MIEVDKLCLVVGENQIIRSASFSIAAGEKAVIHGESGCGKSSLLKALIGMYRPSSGSISINRLKLSERNLPHIRKRLFYLPQTTQILEDQTVREFTSIPFDFKVNRGQKLDPVRRDDLLRQFQLAPRVLEEKMTNLSGGERQRIALIRGLLVNRDIWLLDEATSAMDERNKRIVIDILLGAQDKTIVAVTHDSYFIERATCCIAISDGTADMTAASK